MPLPRDQSQVSALDSLLLLMRVARRQGSTTHPSTSATHSRRLSAPRLLPGGLSRHAAVNSAKVSPLIAAWRGSGTYRRGNGRKGLGHAAGGVVTLVSPGMGCSACGMWLASVAHDQPIAV